MAELCPVSTLWMRCISKQKFLLFSIWKPGTDFVRTHIWLSVGRCLTLSPKIKMGFFHVVISSNREFCNLKSLKFFTLSIMILLIYVILKNVVKFSFAGKTNFSSVFEYGAVLSPRYGHNVDLSKSSCLFSVWKPGTNTAMTHVRVFWKSL